MRFLLLSLVLGSLLMACSSDKPKRLRPEDVTVEELRALIPVELVPTGFVQQGPSPNAPPVPTPTGTYSAMFFRNDSGSTFGISVFADGKGSLGDPVGDLCRNWQAYTKTKDCPVKREQAASVGQKAVAYSSGLSLDSKAMHTTIFVRNGLRVSVGAMIGDADSRVQDAVNNLMKAIDERIQVLVKAKLDAR